jgi:AcrR family transcriptional regulator
LAQVLKADVRHRILDAGRSEFLEHGFQGASMRAIAKRAGCALSNVYNYFESKDALFCAIVAPCLEAFFENIEAARAKLPARGEVLLSFEERREHFWMAIQFLEDHREDLVLLVLKSEGSTAGAWQEAAIRAYESVWFNYIEYLRRAAPEDRIHKISDFFVHNIARFYFNTLVTFLRQEMPVEEMRAHVEELLHYAHGGITALLLGPRAPS